MNPIVPDSEVVKKGDLWLPKTKLTVGGWVVLGSKSKDVAECSLNNLNYAFEQGWRAREEEMRKSLNLEVEERWKRLN